MSHEKQASIKDSMQLISTFLDPIRSQAEKEASMKTAADDSSTSFKDTKAANPEEQAKPQAASTAQTNLGKEQSTLAAEGLPQPAVTAKPNSEADEKKPTDDQGTETLMVDEPTTQFPKEVSQEITQEQKVASIDKKANAILSILAGVSKEASDNGNGAAPAGEAGGSAVKPQPGGENSQDKMVNPPAGIPNDLDGSPEGGEKTASVEEQVMMQIDKTAAYAAQEYFEGYRAGLIKRAQDEFEVSHADIDPNILEKVGGVEGLLDKVAMEFPEAVVPDEVMAEGGMPMEEGMPEVPMDGGPAPEEAMGEMPEGDPLDAVAAALDEAGVTPEELQQAMEDVQALQEAGVPPEELAQALTEITGEGGEMGAEMGAEEAMEAEAPEVEEAAEEGAEEAAEKEASDDWTSKVREILSR